MEETLNASSFPPLRWDEYFWTSTIVLRAWAGFQSRLGPYGTLSSTTGSDGTARLTVNTADEKQSPPAPEQTTAYQHLVAQQESVRDAILQAVFQAYPELQESYGYEAEEAREFMPDIERPDQFKTLIGLSNVHILTVAHDGIAYVGFEFGCTWDNEHGLGVMTHRGRVVEVGGADTAFLDWIAERDVESSG